MGARRPVSLSVVIATRDRGCALRGAIESVLAQERPVLELVVVDDGSRDRTQEVCEEMAARDACVKVLSTRGVGRSAARNLGLEHVRGRWVTFLDDDDLLAPEYASTLVPFAEAEGFAAGASHWADFVADLDERVTVSSLRNDPGRWRVRNNPFGLGRQTVSLGEMVLGPRFALQAITCLSETLRDLGGFREDLECAEDYDLWLRLLADARELPVKKQCLAYCRRHEARTSENLLTMSLATVRVLEAFLDKRPWAVNEPGAEQVRRRLAKLYREIAYCQLLESRGDQAARAAWRACRLNPRAGKPWFYLLASASPRLYQWSRSLWSTSNRLLNRTPE